MKKLLSIILFVVFVCSTSTIAFAKSKLLDFGTVVKFDNMELALAAVAKDVAEYAEKENIPETNVTNKNEETVTIETTPKTVKNINSLLARRYFAK